MIHRTNIPVPGDFDGDGDMDQWVEFTIEDLPTDVASEFRQLSPQAKNWVLSHAAVWAEELAREAKDIELEQQLRGLLRDVRGLAVDAATALAKEARKQIEEADLASVLIALALGVLKSKT